jgi:hypothetical protein
MPRIPYRGTFELPHTASMTEDQRREAVRAYATKSRVAAQVDPRLNVQSLVSNSKKRK